MSILTAPAVSAKTNAVQSNPAPMSWGDASAIVGSGTASPQEIRQALAVLSAHAESYVARYGTPHAEYTPPTADDDAWLVEHCDHIGWPVDGELSPEEQAAELATLDRYNDALEAMYADRHQGERIESGVGYW